LPIVVAPVSPYFPVRVLQSRGVDIRIYLERRQSHRDAMTCHHV
jgi:hypothetical protein